MSAWTIVKAWLLKDLIDLGLTVAIIAVVIVAALWIAAREKKKGEAQR